MIQEIILTGNTSQKIRSARQKVHKNNKLLHAALQQVCPHIIAAFSTALWTPGICLQTQNDVSQFMLIGKLKERLSWIPWNK